MRTTVSLDDDVMAAVERLRQERRLGLSEAVNQLVRAGLAERTAAPARPYQHRVAALGIKTDVSNVAEVLELLDESGPHRAP